MKLPAEDQKLSDRARKRKNKPSYQSLTCRNVALSGSGKRGHTHPCSKRPKNFEDGVLSSNIEIDDDILK